MGFGIVERAAAETAVLRFSARFVRTLIFADRTPKAGLRFVGFHWKRFSNQWGR
jgi:hypothetical protein